MDDNELICPFCGSRETKIEKETEERKLPFGPTFSYETTMRTCAQCQESWDSGEVGDESYETALAEAEIQSIEEIIEYLNQHGNSMAYIERALELPQRTLVRWKSKGGTKSGIALMRMIRNFPWLLDIAKNNYDKNIAVDELIKQGDLAYKEQREKFNMNVWRTNSESKNVAKVKVVSIKGGEPHTSIVETSTQSQHLSAEPIAVACN